MSTSIRLISLTILLLTVAGCASLKVQVDVLDPETVQHRVEEDLINRTMPEILAEDETAARQVFADVENKHYLAYLALRNQYELDATQSVDDNDRANLLSIAERLEPDFNSHIAPIYRERERMWFGLTAQLRALYAQYVEAENAAAEKRLRTRIVVVIQSRDQIQDFLETFIAHDLDRRIEENPSPGVSAALSKTFEAEAVVEAKQLFTSGGLLTSRYAYYVVKAENKNWAEVYDRTLGKGFLGNTDIAIKALGPGNFTIKGLSFNPADVAVATSKVTTQSVLLAAQIAGVPVNVSGQPSGTGAALAQSSTRLAQIVANEEQLKVNVEDYERALLRVAQAIVDERVILDGDDDNARKGAIEAIRAVYDSQVSRLTVSSPQSGP